MMWKLFVYIELKENEHITYSLLRFSFLHFKGGELKPKSMLVVLFKLLLCSKINGKKISKITTRSTSKIKMSHPNDQHV
jgi:hypothetical protein